MVKKVDQIKTTTDRVESREITEEMKDSYLDYAMSVIVARALPDVRDGLKPVHRRILYAMLEDGLKYNAKFRKSATIVGATLGRYHPHGDQAVYDSLVRMAQGFSLRYPLIQGQGNFGCFTKDTKVKLCDNRSISFGQLIKEQKNGRRHWTFAFNSKSQKIEIVEVKKPRLTKKQQKLIEISLDSRKKIRCTLNHRFMLRDGSYVEAQNLQSGDSLMPLYIKLYDGEEDKNLKGYRLVYQPASESSEVKVVNHKVVKTQILKEKEDVYDLTIDELHNFALDAGIFVHNSIDGDPPSAMRYSEAKLSKIGEEMLKDIDKDTVDFIDNYDGTKQEPTVLPSPVPQLLLNGSLGIAVGMATNIPPHNLSEICDALIYLVDNPKADTEDLFQFVKGPDFPTGGEIFNAKEILQAYSQGKGSIVTRGKAEIAGGSSGEKKQILITEIPYQVQKSSLVEKFAELVQNKKVKGIKDIRDESDKDGMRIVIDLQKGVNARKILNQFYKFTNLQKKFYLNMLALIDGIQPKVLSLVDFLSYFLEHRKNVVVRRTQYDLNKAKERAHILEGLVKCLSRIDEVIQTIKKSASRQDAHQNLMKRFKLSSLQAEAILETKLSALAKLERTKIEDELKEIQAKIKELTAILKSPKKVQDVIKKELIAIKQEFGDQRKTKVNNQMVGEFTLEDLIPQEQAIVTVTRGGYIKRLKPSTYKAQHRGGKGMLGMKTMGDDIIEYFLLANTHDSLLLFTDLGKVFQVPAYEIPEGTRVAKGRGLMNFVEISSDEKVLSIFALEKDKKQLENKCLVMVTKNGIIKKTALDQFSNMRRSGLIAISLKKGDILRKVELTEGSDEILLVSRKGQSIRFPEKNVRPMGRSAAGVKGIRLKKGDEVVGMEIIKAKSEN